MTRLTAAAVAAAAFLCSMDVGVAQQPSMVRIAATTVNDLRTWDRVRHGSSCGRAICARGASSRTRRCRRDWSNGCSSITRACRSSERRSSATRTPALRNPSSARCPRASRWTRVPRWPPAAERAIDGCSGRRRDAAAPDRTDHPADGGRRTASGVQRGRRNARRSSSACSSTRTPARNCCGISELADAVSRRHRPRPGRRYEENVDATSGRRVRGRRSPAAASAHHVRHARQSHARRERRVRRRPRCFRRIWRPIPTTSGPTFRPLMRMPISAGPTTTTSSVTGDAVWTIATGRSSR